MSDVKQAISQDAAIPTERLKEARNVEFLGNLKGFKKGDKSVMHVSLADTLEKRYSKLVKVTKLDVESEVKKAKKVAGVEE